jgi:hypothetical protein
MSKGSASNKKYHGTMLSLIHRALRWRSHFFLQRRVSYAVQTVAPLQATAFDNTNLLAPAEFHRRTTAAI